MHTLEKGILFQHTGAWRGRPERGKPLRRPPPGRERGQGRGRKKGAGINIW